MFFCRILIFFLVIICCCAKNNAQVNNTGGLYIAGAAYINSSFNNSSGASYLNDGNLYLTGDFINNQTLPMAEGAGITRFTGTILQNMSGAKTPVFHDVYINNAAGVQMNINVTMGGTISPVTGSLYFNDHALTMGGKIDPAYTNAAAFSVTALSDLIITGNAASGNSLYFATGANTMHNLKVSSGADGLLGNALNITPGNKFGTVTVDGNFNAAGFLTLKSDSNGTARVGESLGVIGGNATVERYIPPRRAWRFLSVPFAGSNQTIRDAWQEGVNNTDLNYANNKNPDPGFGTHITGNNNTSLGYDYNTTINPSIKVWDPFISGWNPAEPASISANIAAYNAYCIFVRGSRAVNLALGTGAPTDPTVLRITGQLNQNGATATKNYSGTAGNVVFVGNPYASTINISDIINTSGGIEPNKFWVWDPKLAGLHGVGGYVSYSNGVIAPPSSPSYPDAQSTLFVQSGQAFMVQLNSTSTNASIKFAEVDKDSSQSNVFGLQAEIPFPVIYSNLMTPSGSNLDLVDGVAAGFSNGFSKDIDGKDARKRWNFDENIALVRNDSFLAIELRPMPVVTDTLFFKLYLKQQQPYALQIFSRAKPGASIQAWLVDKYLHIQKEVILTDTTLYNFTPNTDTNSYRNRFMLVFKPNPAPGKDSSIFKQPDSTSASLQAVVAFPNPVIIGGKAMLLFNKMEKGIYEVTIYNIKGQKLLSQKIEHNGGTGNYMLNLPSSITAGVYDLRFVNKKAVIKTIKLIIVSK